MTNFLTKVAEILEEFLGNFDNNTFEQKLISYFWKIWAPFYFKIWSHCLRHSQIYLNAKPQVSLTVPNCDHFVQVSLTVLDNFFDAIAKAKKLFCKSVAQNLKRVSLTKSFLAVAMAFNLLLSNPT